MNFKHFVISNDSNHFSCILLIIANSQAINEGIIGIIEDFRQQMPCGFNDSGIPILAPLLIDLLELDIEADGIR